MKLPDITNKIQKVKDDIIHDGYIMTISELSYTYKHEDMIFIPKLINHQVSSKTNSLIIESVLIGLPTPTIVVQHDTNGNWIVLNHTNFLLAVFGFMGILDKKNLDFEKFTNIQLIESKLIKKIKNILLDDLPEDLRNNFLRTKINIQIMLTKINRDTLITNLKTMET